MERREVLKQKFISLTILAFAIYQTIVGVMAITLAFGIPAVVSIALLFFINFFKLTLQKNIKHTLTYILIISISSIKYLGCFQKNYTDLRLLLVDCTDFFIFLLALYFVLMAGLLIMSGWKFSDSNITDTFIAILLLYVTSPIVRVSESEVILAIIEAYAIYKVIVKNRENALFFLSLVFILINFFNNLVILFFGNSFDYIEITNLAEYIIIELITIQYLYTHRS